MRPLLLYLLFFSLAPSYLGAQYPQEGRLRYLVEMRYNEQAPRAGMVIRQPFEVVFDSAYIKTGVVDTRPIHFSIQNRATGQARRFSDFYGYHFEFLDSLRVQEQLGDYSITHTGKTKQILGIHCERVIIEYHKYETEMEAYVAPNFPINYPWFVKGCAFEFSIPTSRGPRVYQLTEIHWEEVDASLFQPQGYQKIYRSELSEAVKGR